MKRWGALGLFVAACAGGSFGAGESVRGDAAPAAIPSVASSSDGGARPVAPADAAGSGQRLRDSSSTVEGSSPMRPPHDATGGETVDQVDADTGTRPTKDASTESPAPVAEFGCFRCSTQADCQELYGSEVSAELPWHAGECRYGCCAWYVATGSCQEGQCPDQGMRCGGLSLDLCLPPELCSTECAGECVGWEPPVLYNDGSGRKRTRCAE